VSTIEAAMFQSQHARAPHPVFSVNGQSLDVWLNDVHPQADVLGLVPAQGWLIDDEEFKCAWERISSVEPGTSTIVPVLVCSDDVDLTCTVVVVEQKANAETVAWLRFGFSRSAGIGVGTTTQWLTGCAPLEFDRGEFERALTAFKSLANSDWK